MFKAAVYDTYHSNWLPSGSWRESTLAESRERPEILIHLNQFFGPIPRAPSEAAKLELSLEQMRHWAYRARWSAHIVVGISNGDLQLRFKINLKNWRVLVWLGFFLFLEILNHAGFTKKSECWRGCWFGSSCSNEPHIETPHWDFTLSLKVWDFTLKLPIETTDWNYRLKIHIEAPPWKCPYWNAVSRGLHWQLAPLIGQIKNWLLVERNARAWSGAQWWYHWVSNRLISQNW